MTSISNPQSFRKGHQRRRSRIAIATALAAFVLGTSLVAPAAQADSRRGHNARSRVEAHRVTRLPTRPSPRATRETRADRVPARPGRGNVDRVPARPGERLKKRVRDFRD